MSDRQIASLSLLTPAQGRELLNAPRTGWFMPGAKKASVFGALYRKNLVLRTSFTPYNYSLSSLGQSERARLEEAVNAG